MAYSQRSSNSSKQYTYKDDGPYQQADRRTSRDEPRRTHREESRHSTHREESRHSTHREESRHSTHRDEPRHSTHSRREGPSKDPVKLPPMRYKLTKLTQAQTLLQIAIKTNGFCDMSANSADWIQRDVRSREFSSFGSIPAPKDMSVVEKIIGEDDYYLKLTTKNHEMDYICYDSETEEFQVWGEYQCCIRALNEIRYRIHKIETRLAMPVQTVLRSDDYDEDTDPAKHFSDYTEHFSDYAEQQSIPFEKVERVAYSKFATSQMTKMGNTLGKGLGAKGTGRIEPINPVSDLGGRTNKSTTGLGYVSPLPCDIFKPEFLLEDNSNEVL